MHGVHAIQEWLIPAGFQPGSLREVPGEEQMGANLRSGMGIVLRRLDWVSSHELVIASPRTRNDDDRTHNTNTPVMPGLDPGIHGVPKVRSRSLALKEPRGWPGQARP